MYFVALFQITNGFIVTILPSSDKIMKLTIPPGRGRVQWKYIQQIRSGGLSRASGHLGTVGGDTCSHIIYFLILGMSKVCVLLDSLKENMVTCH